MSGKLHQLGSCGVAKSEEDRRRYESLWNEFFRDPSQWWDNSTSKRSPKHADFKHKFTKDSLLMDGCYNPPWVIEELRRRGFASLSGELCRSTIMGAALPVSLIKAYEDGAAFVVSLRACTKNKDLHRGIKLHDNILKMGLVEKCSDALVTMYAKCGELEKAKELLNLHNSRDVITWTALIAAYARKGQSQRALNCFDRMQHEGISPNAVTYTCILNACATMGAVVKGEEIHNVVAKQGLLENNIVLGNALIDMYAKCGALPKAQDLIERLPSRDVVSWNALIGGYAREGQGEQALTCFEHMQHEGISPDAVTYICILKACATIGEIAKGEEIHDEIRKQGLLQNNMALATALLDMYAKCGALSKAQKLLKKLRFRNVVSWNTLIAGYVQDGQGKQALDCLNLMQREGISPDAVTYLSILKACATIRAIEKGQEIHERIAKDGLLQDSTMLGNALVDMYAKCGALSKAQDVLQKLPSRNVVSWSTLIEGYAQEGQGEQALHCFELMLNEGIRPDAVTFVSLLNVCSHLGLVDMGHALFASMKTKFGVIPNSECYTCMVDLLGRAGRLERALELVQEMPSLQRSAIWLALLDACRVRGDINLGRWAFEQAVQVNKSHGPPYILMGQIYAAAGMQDKARNIEAQRVKYQA
ncbi:hypothetical protein GOP47_0024115 [Adiantum capillus-veneris]|uniref:Pentatricopeptide repeat-containing protein n=1 Tax=Adiantum capillus-veneris TaxID=13818 RepID=A0A9D4U5A4_ADICA|nr:hypothetical protein GOP47_0024115 [Adiantum capillus-veneris]